MSAPTQQQLPAPRRSNEDDCGCLHYPHPENGSLIPLAVQSLQPRNDFSEDQPWDDLGKPPSHIPSLQAAWYWILSPLLVEGSEDRRITRSSVSLAFLRLGFIAPLTSFVLPSWTDGIPALIPLSQAQQNGLTLDNLREELFYDRLPTSLSHVSPVEANASAATIFSSNIQMGGQQVQSEVTNSTTITQPATFPAQSRSGGLSLRPRYLCFLTGSEEKPHRTVSVSDYIREHGDQADTEFIFVSYTRLQFRVATDEEIDAYDYPDEASREANRKLAKRDRDTLVQWGVNAALAAGKKAFWLDFECVRDDDGVARSSSKSEDVYRICDIVRAAHSMIIAIGPSADDKVKSLLLGDDSASSEIFDTEHSSQWLRQWGSRLWTLPELLLCPNEYRIKLYVFGESKEPKELAKRNFAERAWEDAESVKELVNHYEASAILTPLQLIDIALECFARRKTAQFSAGDVAYAIMGLFPDSQRPRIDQNDSGFRAFARLALAIDDGNILARMLCLAPLHSGSQWSNTTDYWGSKLKDFRARCSVVDVTSSDALVVQDLQATAITWDKIERSTRLKYGGAIFQVPLLVAFNLSWIFLPCWLLITYIVPYNNNSKFLFSIVIYMVAALILIFCLTSPFIFLFSGVSYDGTKEKPRIIGIQGAADTATVERHIWGFNHGRLRQLVADDERDGNLNTLSSKSGSQLFTIVDTVTLTMTVVRCTAPPVALLVCGHVGGTDRALLCSFNCKTGSYHREKVLRVDQSMGNQMHRTRLMHLSLTPLNPTLTSPASPHVQDHGRHRDLDTVRDDVETSKSSRIALDSWSFHFRFVLIMVTGAEVFGLDRAHLGHSLRIAYFAGFSFAQLIAFVCLHKGVLHRVTAPALYCNEILCFLELLNWRQWGSFARIVSTTLIGTAIGLTMASLVFYLWSWFSRRQLTWGILAWAVLSREMFNFVRVAIPSYAYFTMLNTALAMATLVLATISSSHLNLPEDVSWLDFPDRLTIINHSAISKYQNKSLGKNPKWLKKRGSSWSFFIPYSALIIMIAFINGAMSVDAPGYSIYNLRGILPGIVSILVGISAGFVLPLYLPILTYLAIFVCCCAEIFFYLRLRILILPLVWIAILDDTDTLYQSSSLLCLSMIASRAGWLVPVTLVSFRRITTLGVPLFAVIQSCLVVMAGMMAVIRKRSAVSTERHRVIQSEYRDSDEQVA